ncbi:MAG: Gfo/Idh/MocA family oxidoreductase [Desulfuromonadaceae bacterium]|nr:Gfo/Idh/MocA family oxidoreductase [Desulfuromonadaceae bacterium]
MTLKAGVIGVGYLGRFHAQKYALLPETELVGVMDADPQRAEEIAQECETKAYADYRDLLRDVDLVSLAVPTHDHYSVARDCLEAGRHLLIEKPITENVAEAEELIEIAKRHRLVFQVGHLERFNPAILAMEGILKQPMFIESHRLAPFKPRGTDVNVVLDLMIHDIDIILSIVRSDLIDIHAVGVPVLSDEVDIANARLQFATGCVANITASRVTRQAMRKMRMFQSDAYISVDFQGREITVMRKKEGDHSIPGLPNIGAESHSFAQSDALLEEIKAFVHSIHHGNAPLVSAEDGKKALEVAIRINESLQRMSGR